MAVPALAVQGPLGGAGPRARPTKPKPPLGEGLGGAEPREGLDNPGDVHKLPQHSKHLAGQTPGHPQGKPHPGMILVSEVTFQSPK